MGNENKDRLDELKQYSIPTTEYWWISGPELAINKRFFKFWTPFIALFFIVSTAIACLTNWWQLFTIYTLTALFINYWYIGWPLFLGAGFVAYVWHGQKQKRKRREQAEALRVRQYQDAITKLGAQK